MERWRLITGHDPGLLVTTLLLACAALAVLEAGLAYRRGRRLAPRTRLGLLGLRLLGVLALLVVGLELTLSLETVRPTGPRVAVLVDRSASMALADAERPDGPPTARIERLRALWSASGLARAAWREQGLTIQARSFAERGEPLAEAAADTLDVRTDGPASDLARALAELAAPDPASADPRPLAGVLLLSDGLFEGADDGGPDPLLLAARALGVPITTVSAGAPAIRDVALAELHAGEFAFVENVTEFSADLIAHGYAGTSVAVDLRRDGAVVATTTVVLAGDGIPVPVRFEVAPDRVGQFVYEIAARPLPGEATTANNSRAFVLKVLRDKVRVLHVAGRPDWDVRALRTLLGRDPNVELLSYYILRGIEDADREDPTAELSLIAFPTDELFKEQLGSFDLVVLHNFDALNHQVGRYLGDIAEYVQEGGALIVIGGDMGLATGDYPGVLASNLPVDTRAPTGLVTDLYKPALTEAGRRHPITAWLAGAGLGDWASLPALDSYNPVRLARHAASIGAAVLLDHPGPAGAAPLLVIAEPGKGRSLVLATGATWRLGFAADLPIVDGARPYDLLWLGAIRWLLRDAAADRLSLETDRPSYLTGEPVTLRAATLGPGYAPEPAVALEWELRPLGAAALPEPEPQPDAAPTPAFLLSQGTWTTDAFGRASEAVPGNLPVGAYEATAWRTGLPDPNASASARARRVFLVHEPGQELARVDADPGERRLAALARATGGLALIARAGDALPSELPLADLGAENPHLRIDSRRVVPLWDGPWALLLVILGLGGEVLLRRRVGLT